MITTTIVTTTTTNNNDNNNTNNNNDNNNDINDNISKIKKAPGNCDREFRGVVFEDVGSESNGSLTLND